MVPWKVPRSVTVVFHTTGCRVLTMNPPVEPQPPLPSSMALTCTATSPAA